MLQENQESDEPPRQSASFRVLQEILETGTGTGSHVLPRPRGSGSFRTVSVRRRPGETVGLQERESSHDQDRLVGRKHGEAARLRQMWVGHRVSS